MKGKSTLKLEIGNWFRPDHQSKLARDLGEYGAVWYRDDLVCEPGNYPAAENLFRLYGYESSRLVQLASCLMWDTYRLIDQPEAMLNPVIRGRIEPLYGEQIAAALKQLRRHNIVYVGEEMGKLPAKLLADGIRLRGSVLLTPCKVGMPVLEFLYWFKGEGDIPHPRTRKLVREWSGIGHLEQDVAYEAIVELLHEVVESMWLVSTKNDMRRCLAKALETLDRRYAE